MISLFMPDIVQIFRTQNMLLLLGFAVPNKVIFLSGTLDVSSQNLSPILMKLVKAPPLRTLFLCQIPFSFTGGH